MEENKTNNGLIAGDLLNRITALAATLQTNSDPMKDAVVEMLSVAEFEDDQAKVEAIASITEVYRLQAVTLQQMISLFEKMYEDIRNNQKSE